MPTGWAERVAAEKSVGLLLMLLGRLGLMELGGKLLAEPLAKGLLDELAGVPAGLPGETPGRDRCLALGVDDDFDGRLHAAPPWTWMVSLIDPSGNWALGDIGARVFGAFGLGPLAGIRLEEAVECSWSPHRPLKLS